MNYFMDKYFGPLPKDYCAYFYALSILFGFSFVFALVSFLSLLLFRKISTKIIVNSLLVLFNLFLGYISNRLLHTICVRSL